MKKDYGRLLVGFRYLLVKILYENCDGSNVNIKKVT